MATAGRILVMPKGKYNEETQYDMLDMVSHDGKGWICKKTCIGIYPASGDYWAEIIDVSEELEAIRNEINDGIVGGTDIGGIADGTITGAIKYLHNNDSYIENAVLQMSGTLGDSDISDINDGSVTGAITWLDYQATDTKQLAQANENNVAYLLTREKALANSISANAKNIENNGIAIAGKIKIQETTTTATIKAGHNKLTLTKPSVSGYTFYPLLCMGDSTKDITISGLGTLNLRVYSAVSTDTTVNFTTTWLGIKK